MNSSFELLQALKQAKYLPKDALEFWWPGSGSFEVLVGAILTQQAKWEKVQKSLENLKQNNILHLEGIVNQDRSELASMIKPSGFYNTKAKNLQILCKNILKEFESFENFSLHVTREWLLNQKGIGCESADSILCYACFKEIMVVDSYTNRLLKTFGYEFESYDALQEWMQEGIINNWDKVISLYENEVSLHFVYARFHGKIVEFCKKNMRKNKVNLAELSFNK
jgi:endonuclease-3 related protein